MALNTPGLAAAIKGILTDMESRSVDSKDEFANRLAAAISDFVKTGTVVAGIPVSTTGSASAQTGATTAPGTII
jgi:predicted NBD/HSP70 family sugar kinase